MKALLCALLAILIAIGGFAKAKANTCVDELSPTKQESPLAGPSFWQARAQQIITELNGQPHPFQAAGYDMTKTQNVHKMFSASTSLYNKIINTRQLNVISLEQYENLLNIYKTDHEKALKSQNANLLFALLECTRMMPQVEAKVQLPLPTLQDRLDAGNNNKNESAKKNKSAQKKPEDKVSPPQNPWIPKLESYTPENKDFSNTNGGKSTNIHVIEVTVPPLKGLLAQEYFDTIQLDRWNTNQSIRPTPRPTATISKPASSQTEQIIIRPMGTRKVLIPKPYEYTLNSSNYPNMKIISAENDEVEIEFFGETVPEDISLPLAERPPESFRYGLSENAYTQTVSGLQISDWPQSIQNFINENQSQNRLTVAARLEEFLSQDGPFLYYSIGDKISEEEFTQLESRYQQLLLKMPKPLAMAHLGAFNCNGAAWIAALILREHFNIPTRAVVGRTIAGFKYVNNVPHYVARSNDPGHAWIEVWNGQAWIPFDPTPKLNKPDLNGQADDHLEQEKNNNTDNNTSDADGSEQEENAAQQKTEQKDRPKPSEKPSQKANKDADKTKNEKTGKETEKESQLKTSSLAENIHKLDQTSHDSFDHLQWLKDYTHYVIEDIIKNGTPEPILARATWILNSLESVAPLRQEILMAKDKIESAANLLFSTCPKSLADCLNEAELTLIQQKPRESYQRIQNLIRRIEFLSEVRPLKEDESHFLNALRETRNQFKDFNRKDGEDFLLVENFITSLPGEITKQIIMNDYGLSNMSPDSESVKLLAAQIRSGKLNHFLRVALVREYAELYLKTTLLPHYKNMILFNRSPNPTARQDITVARSPHEINRMILNPLPGEPLFAPLIQGRQFAIGPREVIQTLDPENPSPYKMSFFFYDVSASMNELQANMFLSALLVAVADITMSERNPILNDHLNELFLIAFGHEVSQDFVHLKNAVEAEAFIRQQIEKPTPAKQGTNITKPFLEFFRIAGERYTAKQKQSPFRQYSDANFILATDGEDSSFSSVAIEKARQQISPDLQLHMNFVAIKNTNPQLQELAENSAISTTQPSYRYLSEEKILHINEMIESYVSQNSDGFISEVNDSRLAQILTPRVAKLKNQLPQILNPKADLLLDVRNQIKPGANVGDLSDKSATQILIQLAYHLKNNHLNGTDHDKRILLSGFLEQFRKQTKRGYSKLLLTEVDAIKIILREVSL